MNSSELCFDKFRYRFDKYRSTSSISFWSTFCSQLALVLRMVVRDKYIVLDYQFVDLNTNYNIHHPYIRL